MKDNNEKEGFKYKEYGKNLAPINIMQSETE